VLLDLYIKHDTELAQSARKRGISNHSDVIPAFRRMTVDHVKQLAVSAKRRRYQAVHAFDGLRLLHERSPQEVFM